MVYWLLHGFRYFSSNFGILHSLSLRALLASLTALLLVFFSIPRMIAYIARLHIGQIIRDVGPQSHFKKSGTPTMGGALVLFAIAVSVLLWSDLSNRYVWLILGIIFGFGMIGGVDDYLKLVLKNSRGLAGRWKLFWQSVIAMAAAIYLYKTATQPMELSLFIPFIKQTYLPLGIGFIVLAYFVIVGASNAVNLTDGLDGLAIFPIALIAGAFSVFAYVTGSNELSSYFSMPYLSEVGEVAVICAAITGAGFAFLWFNTYPAQIFMGDVGAVGLGGALGVIAVIVRQELVLALMGGLFVAETISVILQVGSYKLRRKRIFRMAPLHHHFELKGWPEPRIIVRFWIITCVLVLVGLASIKIC